MSKFFTIPILHLLQALILFQCKLWKAQHNRAPPIRIAAELLEEMMDHYSPNGLSCDEALIAGWEGEVNFMF